MQKNSFIAYEYLTQTVSPSMQATYVDGYANFGWQLQESKEGLHGVTLAFKRDRSITHKSELNRIQKQFEQQMAHVVRLEKSKQSSATSLSLLIGIVGTVFMAGSVFAWEAALILLSVMLAIPGFLAWGSAYFAYRWWQARRSARIDPLIDQQFDAIAETSTAAFLLLN